MKSNSDLRNKLSLVIFLLASYIAMNGFLGVYGDFLGVLFLISFLYGVVVLHNKSKFLF